MSTLHSALDELLATEPCSLRDHDLEDGLLEMERASDVLLAARARWLAEVDRRRSFAKDGYLSAAAWLADRGRMSFAAAKREVCTALALDQMPVAREALGEGEISASAVHVLVEARETDPEEFEDAERKLVDAAREISVKELTATAAEWSREADANSGELDRRLHERRSFTLSRTASGTWRARGELDPETGQTVNTAVRSLIDADVRDGLDLRTQEQRGADAIGEICRQWLDRADRPTVAGERPHVTVAVDIEALDTTTGRAAFEDGGPIGSETARRLVCDASIARVITKGRSEPLEMGRRTPVVPTALRRAVVMRDEHCRFPGCDRPQSWCDAHHVVHWADGGETSLSNLVLLCRPHHRLVHEGFRLLTVGGAVEFRRPDGSLLEGRAPP